MVDMIGAETLPCAAPGPGNGQVKMSLSYASQERKLIVMVHACRCVCHNTYSLVTQQRGLLCSNELIAHFFAHRGLLSQSKDGVDSYVSLMLLPDKSKATKRKTAVKKRDLNPEYNER